MKTVLAAIVLFLWPALALADQLSGVAGRYQLLPSSRIHFSVAQLGGDPVEGEFKRFKGTFAIERNIDRSKVELSLEPASVTTVDPRIEDFIKSEAVFDVARHPTVSFSSTGVTRTGDNSASIDGRLSAKGVTRSTRFAIAFQGQSGRTLKFHVTGKLSRAMFNMDVGVPIYSNYVMLDMDLVGRRM